jgi:hypothetical protein
MAELKDQKGLEVNYEWGCSLEVWTSQLRVERAIVEAILGRVSRSKEVSVPADIKF